MIQEQRAVIRMPDITGLPLRKASLIVENVGLEIDAILFQESYEERDTVLTQKPPRGQMVYSGERVTLGVSRESYAKWLPSIFQRSDVTGRNFLRDLLWITQHLFGRIEDVLDVIHGYFDPLETPEEFLPWLASWTAMVLEEDWPIAKKRQLIKRAIELYRIRGTVKGLKLFIALFTGHEPEIVENAWPFRGFRVGVTSDVGVDTVILPSVNRAHTFLVQMPRAYQDVSVESVIRLHEIIQMEKPANTSYCLTFLAETRPVELREFFVIGARSGIGIGQEVIQPLPAGGTTEEERPQDMRPAEMPVEETVEEFMPPARSRPPLPKAPNAENAPIEGREVRTNLEGGFEAAARQFDVAEIERLLKARDEAAGQAGGTQPVPAAGAAEAAPARPADGEGEAAGPASTASPKHPPKTPRKGPRKP